MGIWLIKLLTADIGFIIVQWAFIEFILQVSSAHKEVKVHTDTHHIFLLIGYRLYIGNI